MSEYAVEIKHLRKKFNQFCLGPIDMKIPKGSIVGYIGQNGAGKSTTIKLILGLLKKDSGEIKVLGENISDNEKVKDKIGVVFDDLFLSEELRICDVERFCGSVYSQWNKEQFRYYLSKFKLPENQIIKNFSRGMKMKLSIAVALSHKAELLVLDEATSGLDPIVREEILDILLEYMKTKNNTILISSHILSDLEKIADHIAFINEGRLLFMERKKDLEENYGICSLTEEQINELDSAAIIGKRTGASGQEILIRRSLAPEGLKAEKPSIEDIMIFL